MNFKGKLTIFGKSAALTILLAVLLTWAEGAFLRPLFLPLLPETVLEPLFIFVDSALLTLFMLWQVRRGIKRVAKKDGPE